MAPLKPNFAKQATQMINYDHHFNVLMYNNVSGLKQLR